MSEHLSRRRVLFRCDGNEATGLGHLSRCLALAEAAVERGWGTHFHGSFSDAAQTQISQTNITFDTCTSRIGSPRDDAATIESVRDHGSQLIVLDSYDTSRESIARLERHSRVLLIDDFAVHQPYRNWGVINFTVNGNEHDYACYGPKIQGPEYLLVRKSLRLARRDARIRSGPVESILLAVGGVDRSNLTGRILAALSCYGRVRGLRIVVSATHPHLEDIRVASRSLGDSCEVIVQADSLAEHFQWADLCICGGGLTKYEAAYLGVPTVMLSQTQEQANDSLKVAACGLAIDLGMASMLTDKNLYEGLARVIEESGELAQISRRGLSFFSEDPTTSVVQALEASLHVHDDFSQCNQIVGRDIFSARSDAAVCLKQSIEIGSEFEWPGIPVGPYLPWPIQKVWYPLGRNAVVDLLRPLPSTCRRPRLHVPAYFCDVVNASWEAAGIELLTYDDSPRLDAPRFDTLDASDGEAVLAMNYFGMSTGEAWAEWKRDHPSVILIEDHSHDPQSPWAKESNADYAFASLRKVLPIPDGAILWSPIGKSLPKSPARDDWSASALKLAGMIWKHEYLNDPAAAASIKEQFRRFQLRGEELFENCREATISPWSKALVENGYPIDWREQRSRNFCQFVEQFRANDRIGLLFDRVSSGACPYNPILVFESGAAREQARQQMIDAGIFTPIHYAVSRDAPPAIRSLSERILTIPLDHRCGSEEVTRAASVVANLTSELTITRSIA